MAALRNGGPHVSWTSVVSTAAFLAVLVGGGWTIFQTQFNSIATQVYENRTLVDKSASLLQAQIDRRISDLEKQDEFLRAAALSKAEFRQYEANIAAQIETLRKQLSVLEATRPTTGELQAANKNSLDTANRLDDRVRYLEQYLLGQNSKGFSAR